MIRSATTFLLFFLGAALSCPAQSPTRISTKAPIINFSLPTFTNPEGYRDLLIRGSEAWMPEQNDIDVKALSLTIFSGKGDNQIDTMILSPSAHIRLDEKIVTGESTLRVINVNDGFEATGEGWKYTHQNKTVTLSKKVRVVLRAEFKNFLK